MIGVKLDLGIEKMIMIFSFELAYYYRSSNNNSSDINQDLMSEGENTELNKNDDLLSYHESLNKAQLSLFKNILIY
jgi:hypothetical protein